MDQTYTYPAWLRSSGSVLIVLAFVVWAITGVVVLTGAPFPLFAFGTVFFAVFGIFGWWIIRSNSVMLSLAQNAISITGGKKCCIIPYNDIQRVSYENKTFKCIVLHTENSRYAIRENLVGYPDLISALRQKIKALQAETGDHLQVKCKPAIFFIYCGIFIAISLALLAVFWIGFINEGSGIAIMIVISIALLIFIALLTLGVLASPLQYRFDRSRITEKALFRVKTYDPSGIAEVLYGQRRPKSYSRFGSPMSHFIELRFQNNRKSICIDQNTTDFPIDGITDYVRKTYPEADFREVRL